MNEDGARRGAARSGASAAAQPPAFTPDRFDLAAAKKENTVTGYTSTPVEVAQKIANLFQQETGIRGELFRSGGSAVLRRFLQEIDARRVVADVLTVSDPARGWGTDQAGPLRALSTPELRQGPGTRSRTPRAITSPSV